MKLSILFLLAILVLDANGKSKQGLKTSPLSDMPEYLVRHKLMKTYCGMLAGRRIYRSEELETRCVEKVDVFGDKVIKGCHVLANCFN